MLDYLNVLYMLLAALSVFGGARYFWTLAKTQRQSRAVGLSSLDWPKASGTITRSEVIKDEDSGWYRPVIAYDYAVAGKAYQGSQIAFAITYPGRRKTAQAIVDRYKAGAAVDVYYDPADPSRCVLERGGRTGWFGPWLSMPFAALCVVLAIALVLGAVGMVLDIQHAGVGH